MDGFVLPSIPTHVLHPGVKQGEINAKEIVTQWLSKMESRLCERSYGSLSELFIEDCWWRDMVGFNWDFSTKHGQVAIERYLSKATNSISDLKPIEMGGLQPTLLDMDGMIWVQGGFTFNNPHGRGRGMLRLLNVGEFEWKAWVVFTQLERLSFQDELDFQRSRSPGSRSNKVNSNKPRRRDQCQVLIVGAGQAGLSLGARLEHMGIHTLLVDRHSRLGDSWRTRYESVKLNTPTYTDHYPFMNLPANWPRWLCRDQVADFIEHYAQMMGLDVLSNTNVTKIDYSESTRKYTVELSRVGETLTFTPNHVVLATGVFSDQPNIPGFQGLKDFEGLLYHSREHRTASQVPDLGDKNVVVIGPATSGHDVAQDFVNHGAKGVAIIQRHPIFYLSAESCEAVQLSLWNTDGLTTEEADVIGNSIPLAVIRALSIPMTQMMAAKDKEMIDGLKKAGMALRVGEDGYGLADYQLIKGGHYYVDQGAGQMIVDGRIKIHRCEDGVKDFQPKGLTLADGTKLDADVVVLATGHHGCLRNVESLMGADIAKKVGDFSALDEENERVGWWRPTGQPGFWYMTGSFMWCRQYSLTLALQIAAIERGLNNTHYD